MREHEVPTHVQTEDRVLLWFTFPQLVALMVVGASAYGTYRYAPSGSAEVRLALAIVLALAGIALIVGKVGGRRLPLVAADLLRFGLGPRRYAGPPSELVRSAAPAPPPRSRGGWHLLAQRARRSLRRRRRDRGRRNGRRPFRPHRWFGKRPGPQQPAQPHGHRAPPRQPKHRQTGLTTVALLVLAVLVAVGPLPVRANEETAGEGWVSPEIEFQPPAPVPGRRLFVEELQVAGDRAAVTLRAATDLDLRVRAYGGAQGRTLLFTGTASLRAGERSAYDLPLAGDRPSFTFAWTDTRGQAGALTLRERQLPYPLPAVAGELCTLRVTSLRWTPARIAGVLAADCVPTVPEQVALPVSAGHYQETVTAVLPAAVTGITGTVTVTGGGHHRSTAFVAGGDTAFQLPIATGAAPQQVTIATHLQADLEVPQPPLAQWTLHPAWREQRTETVAVERPGTSKRVTETVTVTHTDGSTTAHTIAADLSIPSKTVSVEVTVTIDHPERVPAQLVERAPLQRSRVETATLVLRVGADTPYAPFDPPAPADEPAPAAQRPLTDQERDDLFDLLGWEWP